MKGGLLKKILIGIIALFILIQFYPYGRDHTNPTVTNVVKWDSPETKDMFYKACADCHSNETKWPWYSNVAPASWLVQSDVEKGRRHFNISDADKLKDADEAYELVEKGYMPLSNYLLLHSEAKFTEEQTKQFAAGLKATFNIPVKIEQQKEEEM